MARQRKSFIERCTITKLGKLNFVACCVRPGRIFISRLIRWLKVLYKQDICDHVIPDYVKKDILWRYRFLPKYNGISVMFYEHWLEPNKLYLRCMYMYSTAISSVSY